MSLNHLINEENPYTSDDKLNIDVGYIKCISVNSSNQDSGRVFGGTTLTFSNASITGLVDPFYFIIGYPPDNTFILKLGITISAPIASHTFSVEVENANIAYVGDFDALTHGQLCSDSALPCILVSKVENVTTNKVRLVFNTADGSNIVAGSFAGSIYFTI
tara:strand:- start:106 stop:588 length:483 start_codon:yes stop_codon:yes gene_type:complete